MDLDTTKGNKAALPFHAEFRNSFEKGECAGNVVLAKHRLNQGKEAKIGVYFIGLSVAFPLKRFRLPIPDFWRSQHYLKLSWSTCTPDRKQITAENAFSSRPRQRWPIKLATSPYHQQQNERRLERKETMEKGGAKGGQ